jgi:hypothetical protein
MRAAAGVVRLMKLADGELSAKASNVGAAEEVRASRRRIPGRSRAQPPRLRRQSMAARCLENSRLDAWQPSHHPPTASVDVGALFAGPRAPHRREESRLHLPVLLDGSCRLWCRSQQEGSRGVEEGTVLAER